MRGRIGPHRGQALRRLRQRATGISGRRGPVGCRQQRLQPQLPGELLDLVRVGAQQRDLASGKDRKQRPMVAPADHAPEPRQTGDDARPVRPGGRMPERQEAGAVRDRRQHPLAHPGPRRAVPVGRRHATRALTRAPRLEPGEKRRVGAARRPHPEPLGLRHRAVVAKRHEVGVAKLLAEDRVVAQDRVRHAEGLAQAPRRRQRQLDLRRPAGVQRALAVDDDVVRRRDLRVEPDPLLRDDLAGVRRHLQLPIEDRHDHDFVAPVEIRPQAVRDRKAAVVVVVGGVVQQDDPHVPVPGYRWRAGDYAQPRRRRNRAAQPRARPSRPSRSTA